MYTYDAVVHPDIAYNETHVLTSCQSAIMAVSRSRGSEDTFTTVVTGSDQCANLLSQLSTGESIQYSDATDNQTIFTLLCEAQYDQTIYSWQWVSFSRNGGVMSIITKNEKCRAEPRVEDSRLLLTDERRTILLQDAWMWPRDAAPSH